MSVTSSARRPALRAAFSIRARISARFCAMLPVMTAKTLLSAARRINVQAGRRVVGLPTLFFVTDEARCPEPFSVARGLPRGTGIILRHYGAADRANLAARLARLARARGLILLIAADPKLARQVRAHGVHWPEGLM